MSIKIDDIENTILHAICKFAHLFRPINCTKTDVHSIHLANFDVK